MQLAMRSEKSSSGLSGNAVNWPALLKLQGEAELVFLPSESAFLQEASGLLLSDDDRLIDISGQSFAIVTSPDGHPVLQLMAYKYNCSLADITGLVQAHAAEAGNCCVAKIQFTSFRQALLSVADPTLLVE
ncbi:DUF4144 family protein [Pontibacter sp. JAM-7]|uniref:DUF4144 family protein n=1 Tax=Pontibacter sp. JAM-7 TaxID=3366581 RepID=UPI003AF591F5